MSALENVREYIRQRRIGKVTGVDPEAVHGVFFDNEAAMAEITVTDLEELTAPFSTEETEIAVQHDIDEDPRYLQTGSRVQVWFGGGQQDYLWVSADKQGWVEVYSPNGPLVLRPIVGNILHVSAAVR